MKRLALVAFLVLSLAPFAAGRVAAQSFGNAVAVAGDEALIAQPNIDREPGSVFVYRRSNGGWSEADQLQAGDGIPGDRFGASMAVDGDRLLVGAFWADSGRGAAYVFERSGGTWREAAELTRPERSAGDSLGLIVALEADLALVVSAGGGSRAGGEAPGMDDGGPRATRAAPEIHVFRQGPDGAWSHAGVLEAEGFSLGDGTSRPDIQLVDGAAVIGVPAQDSMVGAAWVFPAKNGGFGAPIRLTAAGPGKESDADSGDAPDAGRQESGDAPDAEPGDRSEIRRARIRFGTSVAMAGEELLIGAPGADLGRGAVFVFRQQDGEWREVARVDGPARPAPADSAAAVSGSSGSPPPLFGASIAASGDEALVGAVGLHDFRGGLFRLTRGPEGWALGDEVEIPQAERGDFLGGVLAVGDGFAVAGLPGDDYGAGTAAILERTDRGWRVASSVASEIEPLPAVVGGEVECSDGEAVRFTCGQVDLLSFLPVQELGGARGVELNDIWGWTDPQTGREYALVGRTDGTAFVDVSDPERPVFVGELPKTEGVPGSTWRDIKVYENHAFVVADNAEEHGMQVFDLTRLRDVQTPPETFDPDTTYHRIHSAHNIAINTDTGFAYTVGNGDGGDTCGGGLHMIDIRDPKNPRFAGCFSDPSTGRQKTGYTHDAQCVLYRGPDEDYAGREICFGANETALSIADVTDKESPVAVAVAEYPNVGYTHQAWLTEDHRYLLMDDELDELNGLVENTRTLIWDVTDLDDPVVLEEFLNPNTTTIDHNQYVVGDKVYQSNYVAGLRVLDISDIENPKEVGFFDTVPYGSDGPRFDGSWSNYPFFESGVIAVTSGDEGLFLLRFRPEGERPIS